MLAKLNLNNKTFWLILVIIFSIPTYFFFISHPNDYYNMQDDMQMIRQLEMENCLLDGQIPCRWTPNLGFGYGYPLFNFYPPLPYIVGQMFRVLGFSFMNTAKIIASIQFILAPITMFILASSLFGNIGGFISAIIFAYTPYHALNIYVRGAYNEAWAAVFFPLILYFTKKIIEKNQFKHIIGLSLSFSFLLLSHNPMAFTFTPIVLVWALYFLFKRFKLNLSKYFISIKSFIISAALSISLSAFFTLPVLSETKYVQVETMFVNYFSYLAHYVSLSQLFISNYWGDGPSVFGVKDDGMSFMIGYLQWIIPLLIFLYFIYKYFKTKKIDNRLILPSLLFLFGLLFSFLTHNKSTFIWNQLSILQKIQFPWRLLNHITFLFSLAAGALIFIIKDLFKQKKYHTHIAVTLSILLFFINYSYFKPKVFGPLTDKEKFSGLAWTNQITSGIYDYLPKTATRAAPQIAADFIDKVDGSDYELFGQKKGTDWKFFNITLTSNARVYISQLAFPGFKTIVNGQEIAHEIEPELGRIVLNLSPGTHQVYVKLHNTPVRTISNYISLFAWIGVGIYLLKPLWKKLTSRI